MSKPILWHIPVSHYNEKARWSLAFKGVEHERRTPPPGPHMAVALWLTRGAHKTFPVLRLDGRNIGDSSAIIAALEQLYPDPPLYPDDPDERRRALELEEFFDEELGPHIRLLAWHELTANRDGDGMSAISDDVLPAPLRRSAAARAAARAFGSAFVALRFRVRDEQRAELARTKVVAALDRLEAELGDGEHLVGDRFTVADLTAASLMYPLVLPAEGPQVLAEMPPRFAEFVAPLRERPGYEWVAETFSRYRKPESSTTASISTGTSKGS
jgi:glutathione S-transferase